MQDYHSDQSSEPFLHSPGTIAVIAAIGEVIILLAFAAIGRASHNHQGQGPILGTLGTTAPFLIGWFAAAFGLGTYRASAFTGVVPAAILAARTWLAGGLIGLVLRSWLEHKLVPVSFVAVTMLFNGVLLTGWRALLAAVRPRH